MESRCIANADASGPHTYIHVDASQKRIRSSSLKRLHALLNFCVVEIAERSSKEMKQSSVYVGSPGIAYALLRVSDITNQRNKMEATKYLASAVLYLSAHLVRAKTQAQRHEDLAPSVICGPAGVLLVTIMSNYKQRCVNKMNDYIDDYFQYCERALQEETSNEWMFGRAGLLFGLLQLQRLASDQSVYDDMIAKMANLILKKGIECAQENGVHEQCPLLYEWESRRYIGAAHGMFGILHVLLLVPKVRDDQNTRNQIKQTIDFLLALETPNANYPPHVGDSYDHLVHFCHGAGGSVYLFSIAYQVFGDEAYYSAVLRAGETVWKYGLLKKGSGLCHGISGSAYALLNVYKLTRDPLWLERAIRFTFLAVDTAIISESRVPDHPFSLFEGVAGVVCLTADLIRKPEAASFPFFELTES